MRYCASVCFAILALIAARQMRADSAAGLEQRGDPAGAVRADPRLSSAWIALGLAAESDGRIDQARRDLLEASRVDHQYLPAWTLANFCFRQNDSAGFWLWARRAAELSYDDPRPLLQLAHAIEPDPAILLRRLGGSERLARSDLDYLVGSQQWAAAQQSARLLLARHDPGDRARLLEAADRQLGAGHAAYALELWRGFYPARILSNGSLDQLPSNSGFDWRIPSASGVASDWSPGVLRFSFDGTQCEECPLLEEILPPMPEARRFRLSFEYRTSGLASPSGLYWELAGSRGAILDGSAEWRGATAEFPSRRTQLPRLRLIYQRLPGTVRPAGALELRHLQMETLP